MDVRERVTLVVHDWGSALGCDWANRRRERSKGIAYMEAIVRPQGWDHWDVMNMRPSFLQALRSEAGERIVLQDNFFIDQILPGAILPTLSAEEMAEYRRLFAEPCEGRRPALTWPRGIPIEGACRRGCDRGRLCGMAGDERRAQALRGGRARVRSSAEARISTSTAVGQRRPR
jgi:haloalkane dehalogenase